MTDDKQYEANELFRDLDATTKKILLKGSVQVTFDRWLVLSRTCQQNYVAAFKSTLEESRGSLHVIDASDPNHEEHEKVVLAILKDLDMTDIPA